MKILVHVAIDPSAHTFGIALTPEAAEAIVIGEGSKRKDFRKHGRIIVCPDGVTEVEVTDFGSVQWRGGVGPYIRLEWKGSLLTGSWTEVERVDVKAIGGTG